MIKPRALWHTYAKPVRVLVLFLSYSATVEHMLSSSRHIWPNVTLEAAMLTIVSVAYQRMKRQCKVLYYSQECGEQNLPLSSLPLGCLVLLEVVHRLCCSSTVFEDRMSHWALNSLFQLGWQALELYLMSPPDNAKLKFPECITKHGCWRWTQVFLHSKWSYLWVIYSISRALFRSLSFCTLGWPCPGDLPASAFWMLGLHESVLHIS